MYEVSLFALNRSSGCEGHQHLPHCISAGNPWRNGSHPALPALPLIVLLQVCGKLWLDVLRSFFPMYATLSHFEDWEVGLSANTGSVFLSVLETNMVMRFYIWLVIWKIWIYQCRLPSEYLFMEHITCSGSDPLLIQYYFSLNIYQSGILSFRVYQINCWQSWI